MPAPANNRFLWLSASTAIVMLACSSVQIVLFDTPSPPEPPPASPVIMIPTIPPAPTSPPLIPTSLPLNGLAGFWQDGLNVFTIQWQDDGYVVTDLRVVGIPDPQILDQSWDGSTLSWTYRAFSGDDSPSTFKTRELQGDRLIVDWSSSDGTTGPAVLRRVQSATPTHDGLPFYDDYSDSGTGWDVYDDEYGILKYQDGYYSVRANKKDESAGGYAYRYFGDVVITVDATAVLGPGDNDYGFMIGCHRQANDNGYWFEVDASGYYYVGLTEGERNKYRSLFSGDDWRASQSIHPGKAANHVVVTCAGEQLSLEVNGKRLFQGSDPTYREGDIYLGAITFGDLSAEYHFDNLSVTSP